MLFSIRFIFRLIKILFVLFLLMLAYQAGLKADTAISEKGFDDTLLDDAIELPAWFKLSFLDIKEDINEARKAGKKGLVLYFGMNRCPYCKALIEGNFGKNDIAKYTQQYFDVVAIDVRGNKNVTTPAGVVMSEKDFAIRSNANFTPTLIFYNHTGQEVHRLVGYYAAYRFRATLEYVADEHYRNETFKSYLARGDVPGKKNSSTINYQPFSMVKPYILGRKTVRSQRPLLVMFEQKKCHACNVLHAGALSRPEINRMLSELDVVQLDIVDNSEMITPGEKRTSAKKWSEELDIFYTPTLIFYDEGGNEILRLGSVAHFNRLNSVIRYVSTRAYKHYKNYAEWKYTQ